MSNNDVEYFKRVVKVNNQFTSYSRLDNTVLYEDGNATEWECKDEETAEDLLQHLRKRERLELNFSTLASVLCSRDLTDGDYKECKKFIYTLEE